MDVPSPHRRRRRGLLALLLSAAALSALRGFSRRSLDGAPSLPPRERRQLSLLHGGIHLSHHRDPKTIASKGTTNSDDVVFNPDADAEAFLDNLKAQRPAVTHAGPAASEWAVDVVGIGSATRPAHLAAQPQTWASAARNYWGFTEDNDYDPNCSSNLNEVALQAFLNTCRAPNLGSKEFGGGHVDQPGWFCAQRRVGRALGWLSHKYKGVDPSELPDGLLIVDDDTSVDLDKVRDIARAARPPGGPSGGPLAVAGSVFTLGKYGGFRAAHGGFGTFLDREALQFLSRPIFCAPGKLRRGNSAFMNHVCANLMSNRAGELEVFRKGDNVLDVFYKLSSRPFFCMHSDWMSGYMVSHYLHMGTLEQWAPQGLRGVCERESVSCHYQTPEDMERFAAEHPQGLLKGIEREGEAMSLVSLPSEVQQQLERLKQSEEIWLRGAFRCVGKTCGSNFWGSEAQVQDAAARYRDEYEANNAPSPLQICDRGTYHAPLEYRMEQCTAFSQNKPMLLLEGRNARGRMGNNLLELIHAFQLARDKGVQIGIMGQSWAMTLISDMFFERKDGAWREHFERTLCMKIFDTEEETEGWDILHLSTGDLFAYRSPAPMADYMASQLDVFRRLFANHNTGVGVSGWGRPAGDMCMGINSLFRTAEERRTGIYSVIHSRYLEGLPGQRMLKKVSKASGCHPWAALAMEPEYVKGILRPLGMLDHPVAFISDGENPAILERLLADPELGPRIRVLDESATSLGGDITLAVMSNVFIGNPASSFSTFIGKARLALGFSHNELFRNIDPQTGEWRTVCGDHCLFDYAIQGMQA
ncbi:hypothetical protein ACHAXT_011679 [Thalassiosira profunda]